MQAHTERAVDQPYRLEEESRGPRAASRRREPQKEEISHAQKTTTVMDRVRDAARQNGR